MFQILSEDSQLDFIKYCPYCATPLTLKNLSPQSVNLTDFSIVGELAWMKCHNCNHNLEIRVTRDRREDE